MAIGELARILNAVNTIFERIEQGTALSRRAAAALAIMTLDTTRDGIFSNEWLREQFLSYRISTIRSIAKDASTAKGDLLEAGYIAIGPHVSEFSITQLGKDIVKKISEVEDRAIEDLGLVEELRAAVRTITTPQLPPLNEPPRLEVAKPGQKTGSGLVEA